VTRIAVFEDLNDLVEMGEAWQASIHDTREVNVRALSYQAAGNTLNFKNGSTQQGGLFGAVEGVGEAGVLSDLALAQLAERVGAPGLRWLKDSTKCPNELKEMLFNWKFANWPEAEYLIRQRVDEETKQNEVRAVLSSSYSTYDNFEFIQAIKAAVDEAQLNVHIWRPQVRDTLRAYVIVKGIDFDFGGKWTGDQNAAEAHPMGDGSSPSGLRDLCAAVQRPG